MVSSLQARYLSLRLTKTTHRNEREALSFHAVVRSSPCKDGVLGNKRQGGRLVKTANVTGRTFKAVCSIGKSKGGREPRVREDESCRLESHAPYRE